eukprot:g1328.t1
MRLHAEAFLPALVGGPDGHGTDDLSFYPALAATIVGNFYMVMYLWCIVVVRFINPGFVPRRYPWDPTVPPPNSAKRVLPSSSSTFGIQRKLDGRHRFCRVCGTYKPDRAHHDRMSGHCVLQLDHHDVWLGATIGYKNKKAFVLALFYRSCYFLAMWGLLIFRLYLLCRRRARGNTAPPPEPGEIPLLVFIVLAFIPLIPWSGLYIAFSGFHLWMVGKNLTTVEFCEKRNAPDSKKYHKTGLKVKDEYTPRSPFDVGWCGNVLQVFGKNPLLWGLPVRRATCVPMEGGLYFKVRDGFEPLYEQRTRQEPRRRGRVGRRGEGEGGGGGGGGEGGPVTVSTPLLGSEVP